MILQRALLITGLVAGCSCRRCNRSTRYGWVESSSCDICQRSPTDDNVSVIKYERSVSIGASSRVVMLALIAAAVNCAAIVIQPYAHNRGVRASLVIHYSALLSKLPPKGQDTEKLTTIISAEVSPARIRTRPTVQSEWLSRRTEAITCAKTDCARRTAKGSVITTTRHGIGSDSTVGIEACRFNFGSEWENNSCEVK